MDTTFFTGVNVGYSEEKRAITEHSEALNLVNKALSFIKRSGNTDKSKYNSYPALVVYDTDLKCPVGGEVAVAVITNANLSSVMGTAEKLRAELQQSSLSVSGECEKDLPVTKGLKITTQGDFAEIAKIWQEEAAKVKKDTVTPENPYGTYVSVGVYDSGNGNIVIQGEANPRYFKTETDIKLWEESAKKVADAVAGLLGTEFNMEIKELGFSYLRAKEQTNSRGEKH